MMASAATLGPYARALSLSCRGVELRFRGHRERSDDKFREALAVARAVGVEDCLVTAYLTVEVAERDIESFSCRCGKQVAPQDRLSAAAKLRELVETINGAAAVAWRRRAAGATQPAEQAWYVAHQAVVWRAQGSSESKALADAKRMAPLGSETTVLAACATLQVLSFATTLASFSATELSGRLAVLCDLVDEAVALAGPQRVEGTYSGYEAALKSLLLISVEEWRQQRSTAAHVARLEEALKQLSLHSVLNAAGQALHVKKEKEGLAKMSAAEVAASAPELRRTCALASCGAKEAHKAHFSRCSACKTVVYCSKDCQLADWPAHKKACKAAQKAADEAKNAAASNAVQ